MCYCRSVEASRHAERTVFTHGGTKMRLTASPLLKDVVEIQDEKEVVLLYASDMTWAAQEIIQRVRKRLCGVFFSLPRHVLDEIIEVILNGPYCADFITLGQGECGRDPDMIGVFAGDLRAILSGK